MKIRQLLAMAAVALLCPAVMTSCISSNDDDRMNVTTTYSQFFNAINDPQTGETELYPGVSYILESHLHDGTANLRIEGLRLPDGASYPSMVFVDVPMKANTRGWSEISLSNATPEGTGGYLRVPTFTSLTFQTVGRYLSTIYAPCVNIRYVVDGYIITSYSEQVMEIGETVVTDKTSGEIYKPADNSEDAAVYLFNFAPNTRMATVTISGAKFHKDMPAMNLRFSDIPFDIDASGNIVMAKESLVPSLLTGSNAATATATPMPSIPVSDFKATYDPDRGLWVSYTCSPNMEKFKGEFYVTMTNEYPATIVPGTSAN